MPVVSIIIPTHDRGALLMQTLESVRAQTFGDFEAIVVDDHSEDDTLARLAPVEAQDRRIRHISLPDGKSGAQAARNAGIAAAAGDYLILLDSDDLLASHCLEGRVRVMEADPSLDAAVFGCEVFRDRPGDTGTRWNTLDDRDDIDRLLAWDVPWQTTSPIWRTRSIRGIGEWDEAVAVAQDWYFHLQALVKKIRYTKHLAIDHYWRAPSGERESIGAAAVKPALIQSRAETTKKALALLKDSGQLTEPRKRLFAGLFFQAADRLASRVNRCDGRALWQYAIDAGVVPADFASIGRRYFRFYRFSRWQKKTRRAIEQRFGDLPLARSRTSLVSPVGAAPTISCVMPAYNAERYIESAVDSILRQTWRDFELIVVDDGSKDRTLEILRGYERRDARVRVVSRPNTGHTGAINDGIAVARGEFIARMDGDDLALPTRFEKQLAFLCAHPEVVVLGASVELIDPYDIPIGIDPAKTTHDEINAQLLGGSGGAIRHPLAMFRREAYERVGPYRQKYNGSEDLDLWLRLGEIGQLANLPEVLLKYRRHYEAFSFTKNETQMKHKALILGEARQRRGLPEPAEEKKTFWRPAPVHEQVKTWGWKALQVGRRDAAMGHAKSLLRLKPFSPDAWRLYLCALRGR